MTKADSKNRGKAAARIETADTLLAAHEAAHAAYDAAIARTDAAGPSKTPELAAALAAQETSRKAFDAATSALFEYVPRTLPEIAAIAGYVIPFVEDQAIGAKQLVGLLNSFARADSDRQQTPAECQVEVLGRELAKLQSRSEELDKMHSNTPDDEPARGTIEAVERFCADRRYQIESAIPALRPQGIPGAIVSLTLASTLIDWIKSNMPKIKLDEDKRDMDRDFRNLNALMYGILGALRAAAPGVYECTAGDFYMSERHDPFRAMSVADLTIQRSTADTAPTLAAA